MGHTPMLRPMETPPHFHRFDPPFCGPAVRASAAIHPGTGAPGDR